MAALNLYTIFHLNAAYSSLSEANLPKVLKKCYWPLLKLISGSKSKIGLEATGYTLEKIAELDSKWIAELKKLIKDGKCEFVGSGYTQIVGPLVPAEVNMKNFEIGNEIYEKILGVKPEIWYVNEHAFSQGLIALYKKIPCKAIVMEYNNAVKFHPEWKAEFLYNPQSAIDQNGVKIKIIWNDTTAFQKFQRYAHGEIKLAEYMNYLKSHVGKRERFFPIYASDTEVFDFRPGRYSSEAVLEREHEWLRIEKLFRALENSPNFGSVFPSRVLNAAKSASAFNELRPDSPAQPIVVKKQEKYNLLRWGLTGADDIGINTACYKIYKKLLKTGGDWKELCYLWDSDFRTHIEKNRYEKYRRSLQKALGAILARGGKIKTVDYQLKKTGRLAVAENDAVELRLNMNKGMSISALTFKKVFKEPLIVTLPHDYFDDIAIAADFYSGHSVLEAGVRHKITDLAPVEIPEGALKIRSKNEYGTIDKEIFITKDGVDIRYDFKLKNVPAASLRTAFITLNPKAFDKKTLYYKTKNGGLTDERYALENVKSLNFGEPVSALVSAKNALGNTGGVLEIGDAKKKLILKNDMSELAALPLLHLVRSGKDFLFRIIYSVSETDDTSLSPCRKTDLNFSFTLSISAEKT